MKSGLVSCRDVPIFLLNCTKPSRLFLGLRSRLVTRPALLIDSTPCVSRNNMTSIKKKRVVPTLSGSHGHTAIKAFSMRVEIQVIMLAHVILVFNLFTQWSTLGNSILEKSPEGWMMDACCNIKAQSSADRVKTEMARL